MIYSALYIIPNPSTPEFIGIISAFLDQYGFEGIFEEDEKLTAYIPKQKLTSELIDSFLKSAKELGCKIQYSVEDIQEKNWNELWESNFEPVLIDTRCVIRAPFHDQFSEIKYRITIEPKMSFGTGHHQTTRMMIEKILTLDLAGKVILDMGCGTGVLSILASLMGADQIIAIDIDKWAFENTIENLLKNNVDNVNVLIGGKESIPDMKFNIIFANINRNILLDLMPVFERIILQNGLLLISGILNEDINTLNDKANNHGFYQAQSETLNNWSLLMFERK